METLVTANSNRIGDVSQHKQSAASVVLDELLRGIETDDYCPGERLNAAKIGKRLKLSQAPVREALHILAGQNVVVLKPGCGAALQTMSKRDVCDFWSIAKALGRTGIELATPRIELADNRQRISDLAQEIHTHSGSGATFYARIAAFHRALIEIAANRFLESFTQWYLVAYWEHFVLQYLPFDIYHNDYAKNYERISKAVLAGDTQAAVATWEYHCRWAVAIIEGETMPEPGAPWAG